MSSTESASSLHNISEKPTRKEIINSGDLWITSTVFFPGYLKGGPDKLRGKLVIEAVKETLKKGYNMSVVVSSNTPKEYKQALQAAAGRREGPTDSDRCHRQSVWTYRNSIEKLSNRCPVCFTGELEKNLCNYTVIS
jgi:hypothetical protein